MATKDRANNNKNLKALFSVICLCIISLGLIVYFSSQTKDTSVNENTTVRQTETTQEATEVQNRVTVKDTTEAQTQQTSEASTQATTQAVTMEMNETNTPYKSYYKYPCGEEMGLGYSQELVKNETMGDYRAHTAVDFNAEKGSKVVAINDGIVLSVTRDNLYSTIIEIDHGGKLVARYCGFDTVNVSQGDFVTIGQTLGTLGVVAFESKSESHLHFETKIDGEYVNPLDVMSKTD